jgi:hypothetical protein
LHVEQCAKLSIDFSEPLDGAIGRQALT